MKKLVKKLKGHKQHSSGLRGGRSNPLVAIALVAIVALTGVSFLKASFAAQDATIVFRARNQSGQLLSGASSHFSSPNGGSCTQTNGSPPLGSTFSTVGGFASYAGCASGASYCIDESDTWGPPAYSVYIGYYAYAVTGSAGSSITGTCLTPGPGAFLQIDATFVAGVNLTFTPSASTITKGQSVTLNWNAVNAASCSASGGWSGAKAISGAQPVAPTSTTTYNLYCVGGYQQTATTKSFVITVNNPPPPPAPPPTTPTPPPTKTPTPAPSPTTKPPTPPPPTTKKTTTPPAPPPPPAPAIVKATTGDTVAPLRPESTISAVEDDKATITWAPATDNVGIVGYQVERSTDQLEWKVVAEKLTEPKFEDLDVVKGTHYYYRIRALDAAGNQSEASFADIEIPVDEIASTQKSNVAVKNGGSSKAVLAIVGTLLVLGALGGGAFWFNKRRAAGSYDDTIRLESFDNAINTTEPTSPHASESLKEMVMHDKDPKE